MKNGNSVIADTTSNTKAIRDGLRKIAVENNADAIVLYIDTPLEIVKERWQNNRQNNKRADVTDEAFSDVVNNFEIPSVDENTIQVTPEMNLEVIL